MGKSSKEEKTSEKNEVATTENSGIAVINSADFESRFDVEVEKVPITSKYLAMESGEVCKFIFGGMGKFEAEKEDGKTELLDVVNLFDRDRNKFISAGAVLVSTLKDRQAGTLIEVEYLGKRKTKGGFQVDDFRISELFAKA